MGLEVYRSISVKCRWEMPVQFTIYQLCVAVCIVMIEINEF